MEMRQNPIKWPQPLSSLIELADTLAYGNKTFKVILFIQIVIIVGLFVALQFFGLDESMKYYTESSKGLIWFYGFKLHYGLGMTLHYLVFLAVFLITWLISWICHKNRLRIERNKRLDAMLESYNTKAV